MSILKVFKILIEVHAVFIRWITLYNKHINSPNFDPCDQYAMFMEFAVILNFM